MYGNTYPKRSGVGVRIIETGEEFDSLAACAKYLGVDPAWLSRVSRGDSGMCTVHGYHIDRVNDYFMVKDVPRGRPGVGVRIVETGEEFNSITECAKAIDGSIGTIFDIIHNRRGRLMHKGYHFEKI